MKTVYLCTIFLPERLFCVVWNKAVLALRILALEQDGVFLAQRNNPSLQPDSSLEASILQHLPAGTIVLDENNQLVFISETMLKMLKLQNRQQVSDFGTFLLPSVSAKRYCAYQVNYKPGTVWYNQELLLNRADGRRLRVQFDTSVVGDEWGKIHHIIHTVKDMGPEREFEQVLLEKEPNFRSVFMGSGIAMAISDKDGFHVLCNPRVKEFLGYDSDELKNINFADVTYHEDLAAEAELYKNLLDGKIEQYRIQKRYIHKSGVIKWGWFTASLVRDEFGQSAYIVGMVEDITEMKQVEAERLTDEKKYRNLFENMNIGMVLYEPIFDSENNLRDFKAREINKAFSKQLGVIGEDFLGRNMGDFIPIKPEWFAMYWEIVNTTANRFIEYYSEYFQRHLYVWMFSPGSNMVAIAFTDVTERIKLTTELKRHRENLAKIVKERTKELAEVNSQLQVEISRQKELTEQLRLALEKEKEINEIKSKFISIASHEFRTPLTTILSSVELLKRFGLDIDKELYEKLTNRAVESVNSITGIMDDILTVGKMESGMDLFEPGWFNLELLCNSVIEEVSDLHATKAIIQTNYQLEQDFYWGDSRLIKRMLQNLLSNALKYSSGKKSIVLTVSLDKIGIKIEVADKGIGICKKDLPYIFEAFYRGVNVGEIKGTGLGMQIVKFAVEKHAGTIEIFSKPNKGTTIKIQMPARKYDE